MKSVKLCLVTLAVMFAAINSQTSDSTPMWGNDMTMLPKEWTEEEQMIMKLFLGDEDPTPAPTPSPTPEKPSTFDNIVSAFSKLTNKWSQIVDAFKTTRSSELKERLLGKGFDYFNQSAQLQITKGLKAMYFDEFIKR